MGFRRVGISAYARNKAHSQWSFSSCCVEETHFMLPRVVLSLFFVFLLIPATASAQELPSVVPNGAECATVTGHIDGDQTVQAERWILVTSADWLHAFWPKGERTRPWN
jgi:hypothetical protein